MLLHVDGWCVLADGAGLGQGHQREIPPKPSRSSSPGEDPPDEMPPAPELPVAPPSVVADVVETALLPACPPVEVVLAARKAQLAIASGSARSLHTVAGLVLMTATPQSATTADEPPFFAHSDSVWIELTHARTSAAAGAEVANPWRH